MKKINILHFPIRNTNGGVTRSAMKYWKYINHDRFQFDFATCSKKLDFERTIIEQGCKVHYISCYAEQNEERFCEELRRILLQGYDAIHINTTWWKSFKVEQVAKEVGIKSIIIHARNSYIDINDDAQREKELQIHEKCKREFTEGLATHFLACSREAADFLFGPQISRKRIVLFRNALDIERYRYDEKIRREMRQYLEVTEKFVIGNVGRMAYAKNLLFLLDCFYEIQKREEKAVLLLIGDGELKEQLTEKINQYGICEKVKMIGKVDNVEDYLQAMDLFAFPSRFEGLGNALIEAQTAGLKCITSNRVPMETKITDNITFLELDKNEWIEEILKYVNGYDRQVMDVYIRDAGYDIREEIKVLEHIYEENNS